MPFISEPIIGCSLISLVTPGHLTTLVRLPAGTTQADSTSKHQLCVQPSLWPCTEEALAPSAVCGCQEQTGIVSLLESFQREREKRGFRRLRALLLQFAQIVSLLPSTCGTPLLLMRSQMPKTSFLRGPLVIRLCPGASDLTHSPKVFYIVMLGAFRSLSAQVPLNLLPLERRGTLMEALKALNSWRSLQLWPSMSASGRPLWAPDTVSC